MAVVNVRVSHIRPTYQNLKEWCDDPNNVYIGRGRIVFIDGMRFPKEDSIWANHFKIDKDNTREQVLEKYREYLKKDDYLMGKLHELRGKRLGCWCKPEACHGDILLELINKVE